MIIYSWAGAKAEFKTVLAPAAITITFLCSGIAVSSGIAATAVANAQLLLCADSR
jgi:hypothetical protein